MHSTFYQVSDKQNIILSENCKDQQYSLFKKQWIMDVVGFFNSDANLY
jgi:hypothetical protein